MVLYDHAELSESESESVWCKLKIDNNSIIAIGVCYRSQVASELPNINYKKFSK